MSRSRQIFQAKWSRIPYVGAPSCACSLLDSPTMSVGHLRGQRCNPARPCVQAARVASQGKRLLDKIVLSSTASISSVKINGLPEGYPK